MQDTCRTKDRRRRRRRRKKKKNFLAFRD